MPWAVFDSSALVAALVDRGSDGAWARQHLAEVDVVGPELVLVETANTLRRARLSGALSDREASVAHADLLDVAHALVGYEPFAMRVWELRDNLTSYDAWYVAVAEAVAGPLLTLDARLSRAPGIRCEVVLPSN